VVGSLQSLDQKYLSHNILHVLPSSMTAMQMNEDNFESQVLKMEETWALESSFGRKLSIIQEFLCYALPKINETFFHV
jgi:hypothetical protein